jgi:hypothetical protein
MSLLDLVPPGLRRWVTPGAWGLALVLGIVLAVVLSAWRPFAVPADGFRVEFPGFPMRQQQEVTTPYGTVTLRVYTVMQVLHGATYAASYCVYPPAMVAQMPGTPLETMRDAVVGQTGGKVTAERAVTLGDATGKDITLQEPGVGTMRLRVFMVEDRTYALLVRPVPKRSAAYAERFLESFRLMK